MEVSPFVEADTWRADDTQTATPKEAARARPSGSLLPPGTPVGDYVVDHEIGKGGCGVVYLARHRDLDRSAAIKVLHGSLVTKSKMVERFVREVEVVHLLGHPNIAAVFELGQLEDGRPYCVMEHLRGSTLDAVLRAKGRMSAEEALDILEPVCEALSAAHDAGIVHRDIKASNVLICDDGERRTTKLLDFGIAKLLDPELGTGFTSAGHSLGTIDCMAPEQIMCGPIDARTDVYALGVLLYRLLTTRAPFTASNPTDIALHHLETPPPRPSLLVPASPALDAIVGMSMEKRPERRFDSAQSFLAALREAVGRPSVSPEDRLDREATAAAIYVELRFGVETDELDDELAADIGRALDIAEAELGECGFSSALATGSAVLAARLLPEAPEEAKVERQRALDAAACVRGAIEAREGADPRVTSIVCVHAGAAIVRTSARAGVVGGPVTRMTLWSLPEGSSGLYATPEALEGLSDVSLFDRFFVQSN